MKTCFDALCKILTNTIRSGLRLIEVPGADEIIELLKKMKDRKWDTC